MAMSVAPVDSARRKRVELTPDEIRRQQLVRELTQDFGDSHRPDEIRVVVDSVLERYAGLPAHHYVAHVATREAREALRAKALH